MHYITFWHELGTYYFYKMYAPGDSDYSYTTIDATLTKTMAYY